MFSRTDIDGHENAKVDTLPASRPKGARLSRARQSRVLAFIEAHIADPIRVDELASAAALSRYHFSRAFLRTMGVTPMRYVLERRVEAARLMLLLPDPPSMTRVAYECGFNSQSHFTTSFKLIVGMPPCAYARSVIEANAVCPVTANLRQH